MRTSDETNCGINVRGANVSGREGRTLEKHVECEWVSRLASDASQTRRKFRPGSEEGKSYCHNPELGS